MSDPATGAPGDDLAARLARAVVVIGFDYGGRRIGVAVGNRVSGQARALDVVANHERSGPDYARIEALVREWHPDALLVGLPLTLDAGEQRNSHAARDFAATLQTRLRLPVGMVDERLSSREAAHRFAEQRASGRARRRDAAQLDALAAAVIVEQWLRDTPAP